MSNYEKEKRALKYAKEFIRISADMDAGLDNKIRANVKNRRNNELYNEGFKAGINGMLELEDFVELVEENDKMVPKKDHRNFKAGFANGRSQLEFEINRDGSHRSR